MGNVGRSRGSRGRGVRKQGRSFCHGRLAGGGFGCSAKMIAGSVQCLTGGYIGNPQIEGNEVENSDLCEGIHP
jgi:uncharacterized protein YcfJ